MSKKITEETILAEVLEVPGAEEILAKHNFPCLSCPMAQLEIKNLKIGQVCQGYGLNTKKLLEELNSLIKK